MKTSMLIIALSLMIFSSYSFTEKPCLKDPVPSSLPAAFGIQLERIQNSQIVRVIFQKPIGRSLTVTLRNPEGDEIFRFFVNKKLNSIYRDFNFTDADQGIYKLEVYERKTKVVKQINLQRVKAEEITRLTMD